MVDDEYDDEESRPGFIRRLFRTLFLAAFLIAVGLCGWTIYAYQDMTGKPPWEWDGFQWLGWWKYTVSLGRESAPRSLRRAAKLEPRRSNTARTRSRK